MTTSPRRAAFIASMVSALGKWLERQRLLFGNAHHQKPERVGHRKTHGAEYGGSFVLNALIYSGPNNGILES